jgi:hypothetical protein
MEDYAALAATFAMYHATSKIFFGESNGKGIFGW